MDIKQLKYFICVAENKNVSKAANMLFVSQPTLSQSLRKLESEIGAKLFIHHHKVFELTEIGQFIYERSKEIVNQFDAFCDELQRKVHNQSEILKVGLTSLFALQFMRQISKFIASHASVELYLTQDGSRRLQEKLLEGQIDVGLVSFPIIDSNIEMQALNTTTSGYDVAVAMPKNHPLAQRSTISFKDLANMDIAALNENFMIGKLIQERNAEQKLNLNIIFTHNDWEVLIHSIHELNAVTLLPWAYESYCNIEDIVWVPLADKKNYFPIGIATLQNKTITESMGTFIEYIKQN
ncbi:LysR family transcriptional regulator [Staphylococcus lutrae]|uniref:HTH lysR-type domain-containing protein n=1 Tax=Staphylococcus lutrae TaxID=155085 RepID=A0AAC9RVY8_9STAP|nr:LysR family transcriptional regulator [Staphylococcus lutrae]ARJ50842.1 hypothetical protein B5P37_05670 [Staphylococcus lutrae]PNZ36802.1 LysR family transcriptional regulator [Staphylococcus lutrae]